MYEALKFREMVTTEPWLEYCTQVSWLKREHDRKHPTEKRPKLRNTSENLRCPFSMEAFQNCVKRERAQARSSIISDSSDTAFPSTPAKSLLLYLLHIVSIHHCLIHFLQCYTVCRVLAYRLDVHSRCAICSTEETLGKELNWHPNAKFYKGQHLQQNKTLSESSRFVVFYSFSIVSFLPANCVFLFLLALVHLSLNRITNV